ncbi:MAG: response regulator [Gammaproteobacteria bacterium]|nr:response regulator [Gammaproteobacteria bacterium]
MENPSQEDVTVVVVEPDVVVRTTIAEFLRDCGYRVIEGTEARDVWTVIDSGARVDIVFSEVKLPGKTDGFSLASALRQTHPTIDVILTASIASAAEKATELCDEGPIGKPYHPKDVLGRIHLLLARRRSSKDT